MPPVPIGTNKTCISCRKTFSVDDHLYHLGDTLNLNTLDHNTINILKSICPSCLLKSLSQKGTFLDEVGSEDELKRQIEEATRERVRHEKKFQEKVNERKLLGVSWLFKVLAIFSISALTYSLISKFLHQLNLPNFPFQYYITGYALFIFFALFIPAFFIKSIGSVQINKKIFLQDFVFKYLKNPFALIIVLLNFGSPTFRNIFFSHFESTIWTILFTIMFIASNIVSLSVINMDILKRFFQFLTKGQQGEEQQITLGSAQLLSIPLTLGLYFGLVSPFYLGAIKPGPYGGHIEPEPYKIDHVYEEVLTILFQSDLDRNSIKKVLVESSI